MYFAIFLFILNLKYTITHFLEYAFALIPISAVQKCVLSKNVIFILPYFEGKKTCFKKKKKKKYGPVVFAKTSSLALDSNAISIHYENRNKDDVI